MRTYLVILLLLSLSLDVHARNEAWYQERFCDGETEVVLPDRRRVDCVLDSHAIEYDWGSKWSQAIGQALGYATATGKRAGIVLILKKPRDRRYWETMQDVIEDHDLPIDTWAIEAWKVR